MVRWVWPPKCTIGGIAIIIPGGTIIRADTGIAITTGSGITGIRDGTTIIATGVGNYDGARGQTRFMRG